MYDVVLSRKYKSSLKRVCRHKDFDQSRLEQVVDLLSKGQPLPPQFRDHQLIGSMKNYRECHIKSDILLVYQIFQNELVLLLVDIGSHSDLFE